MRTLIGQVLTLAGALTLVVAVSVSPAVALDDPDGVRSTAPSTSSDQTASEWLDADTPIYQSDFGTSNTGITTLTWQAFLPRESATTFTASLALGRNVIGGSSSWLYANLDRGMIPNGAEITQILFYISDSDAAAEVQGRLCWTKANSGTGVDQATSCPFSVTSSGSAGQGVIFADPNIQVLYRQDIDSDGTFDVVSYHLSVHLPAQSTAHRIQSARILWQRRVSNAPATATFGDVPTGSGIFPFVEALVDSGVTSGCGGGNYCPGAAVTRGQMAVFLSAAMGLNWDWTQTEPNP